MSEINLSFDLHPTQGLVLESLASEVLYGGAASGGKSHLSRVLAILWALEIPGIQIYFFRRLYDDLVKNHIEGPTGFRAMLAPWCNARHPRSPFPGGRLAEVVEGEIRFWNGSKIFLCHLQHQKDLTKYYGPEFHVLFIEEATQFSEYMIKFLRSRLRIPKSLKLPDKYLKPKSEWRDNEPSYIFPRAIYTSNPGGIGHSYIKKAFIAGKKPFEYYTAPLDDSGHVRQFIPAKVDDNPSVNIEDVKANLRGLPANLVDAMLNGNWDAVIGAFFPEIDLTKHLIKPFQIPDHWVRIMGMDWGACGEGDPFSIGWWAVSDGVNTPIPRNALVCYNSWYGRGLPKVTATQVARGIKDREAKDRKIVARYAGGDIDDKRGHGPSLLEIFAGEGLHFTKADKRRQPGHMQFRERLVGKNDKPMIYWFDTFQSDVETIMNLQHDINDPNDCTDFDDHVYEQCFQGVTRILTDKGNKEISSITTNDLVMTRQGLMPVEAAFSVGVRDTYKVKFSNGKELIGTANHPIWVDGYGFKELSSLRYGDMLSPCIQTHQETWLGLFGLRTLVKFPKVFISTIKTGILSTTRLITYNAYLPKSIEKSIQRLIQNVYEYARTVKNNILFLQLIPSTIGSVPIIASATIVERAGLITSKENVNLVRNNLQSINTLRSNTALGSVLQWVNTFEKKSLQFVRDVLKNLRLKILGLSGVQIYVESVAIDKPRKVYNLTVANVPEYYANGVLVHNCRYTIMSRPWVADKPLADIPMEEKFKTPTLDEMWNLRDSLREGRR